MSYGENILGSIKELESSPAILSARQNIIEATFKLEAANADLDRRIDAFNQGLVEVMGTRVLIKTSGWLRETETGPKKYFWCSVPGYVEKKGILEGIMPFNDQEAEGWPEKHPMQMSRIVVALNEFHPVPGSILIPSGSIIGDVKSLCEHA